MAVFEESVREVYLKIHHECNGVKRVSPVSVEFSELTSFIGLKSAIYAEIKAIGLMSSPILAYRDEEGDYVDLTGNHYNRFLKFVSSTDANINIKVIDGCSEPVMQKTPQSMPETQIYVQEKAPDIFQNYTYQTPIEHSMNNLKQEILELEVQSESALEHLQNFKDKFCGNITPGFGKQCSNCHLKLDHNSRQCRLEKCVSSQQCGDINKHQEEKILVESANDVLRKIQKELKTKTVEYETKFKASESVKNSFSEKIRCHLINSNKQKYLVQVSDGNFLPRSGIVNCDIAKLEKYYQGKCPENLDIASNFFENIISNVDREHAQFSRNTGSNSAKRILEENTIFPVKFPRRPPVSTHPNPDSTYQNKGM